MKYLFQVNPQQLQVLVAVVEYKTKLSELRQGLCSKWLSRLTPGRKVPLWIRKGTLRFPSDPVIIIYYLLVLMYSSTLRLLHIDSEFFEIILVSLKLERDSS